MSKKDLEPIAWLSEVYKQFSASRTNPQAATQGEFDEWVKFNDRHILQMLKGGMEAATAADGTGYRIDNEIDHGPGLGVGFTPTDGGAMPSEGQVGTPFGGGL